MAYREVRIYDREFPAMARIMLGDPRARDEWPQEVWKACLVKGEFAVLFRHVQTHHLLMPNGRLPDKPGAELCLVFGNLGEARAYSRRLVKHSSHTVCFIYDHVGNEVKQICNRKALTVSGLVGLLGLLVWAAFFCTLGLGVLWGAYKVVQLGLGHPLPALGSYHLSSWLLFCAAGLLFGLALYLAALFVKTTIRSKRVHKKLTREEWYRFGEELKKLHGSSNPEDHARYTMLWNEMQRKLRS